MATRNVSLTDELDRFIEDQVQSGLYQNASEVVRDALRLLAAQKQEQAARLDALRRGRTERQASGKAD
jgi:antitoxin ParD1/3/4